MTRKQSGFSKPKRTAKVRSQTPSQQQQEQPGKPVATDKLLEASSRLSDDQLNQAILIGSQLAMLDSLSMLQRKAARVRQKQSQT